MSVSQGLSDAVLALLAQEPGATEVILDDMQGREEAERRRLHTIGTLGILPVAAEKGLANMLEALTRLRRTNFYVTDELLGRLLKDREV